MTLTHALDRTLLLMRDEVASQVGDDELVAALTSTSVALIADWNNLTSHSAQTAFVTAANLMARSAHRVFVTAPDIELAGRQPPLPPGRLIAGLVEVGRDMLPGVEIVAGATDAIVDLAVALGDTPFGEVRARRRIRINAEPWAGMIEPEDAPRRWDATWWPMGGMAAGALAAGEAFKAAMLKLLPVAINPEMTAAVFAPTERETYRLAPIDTPYAWDFGEVDFISGGAINGAALYALARLPAARLRGRMIEPDSFAITNLNRYPLMLSSHDRLGKAVTLAALGGGIVLEPVDKRYEAGLNIEPLAPSVVVGVDDIPTRWAVQRAAPDWLVVGATTHWSAMASVHEPGLACAQCLHPTDDPDDRPIPTQACVSFWAGLHVAAYLVRRSAQASIALAEQHIYVTPFRPETPYLAEVAFRDDCPSCSQRRLASIQLGPRTRPA